MIEGNDGGACVSYNGGETFSTIYNQPTGQIYHVTTDDRFPYHVYGTQQDNSAICVPSRSRRGAIFWNDCYPVGHSESGWITVDPTNSNIVISGAVGSAGGGGGCMWKYEHATGQSQLITVWPEVFYGQDMDVQQHRFQWTYPLLFSRHDPRVLLACGERVFRSTDHGQSWEAISDDLTRNDASKQKASGGPISKDTSGAEIYCTIFAFAESAHEPGVYWAGSDDGLVHLSRDSGEKWIDVTPADLPEWAVVNTIETSPHDPDTAYLSATRYKLADRAPYLFKTTDSGASWTAITNGIADDDFTRVIRCDPDVPGLLYVGTETSAYVSFDDGASWSRLAGKNLPAVPVYDLAVKDGDLVAATHGRGFWIFDDLVAIRHLARNDTVMPVALVARASVVRYPTPPGSRMTAPGKNYLGGAAFRARRHADGSKENLFYDAGHNPPDGITVWFYLEEEAAPDQLKVTFHDSNGEQLVEFTPDPEPPPTPAEIEAEDAQSVDDLPVASEGEEGEGEEVAAETAEPSKAPAADKRKKWWENVRAAGLNSFTWDLRVNGVVSVPDKSGKTETGTGFRVPPGSYEARLEVGGETLTARFDVVGDPNVAASQADFDQQFAALVEIRDTVSGINRAIGRLRKVRAQVKPWSERDAAPDEVRAQAKKVLRGLATAEERLTQPKHTHDTDRLKLPPGLDTRVGALADVVGSADAAPTAQARAVFTKLSAQVAEAVDRSRPRHRRGCRCPQPRHRRLRPSRHRDLSTGRRGRTTLRDMRARLVVTGIVACGLAATLGACGAKKAANSGTSVNATKSTSTTAAGSSGGPGSSSSGGSSTTVTGTAAGIQTGAVGYFGSFKYTLKSGTLTPSTSDPANKQALAIVFNYENLSKLTVSVDLAYYQIKLDGDQGQQAGDVKADPSGDVAPGTKGTLTVSFEVGKTFDASKVAVVLGDPNNSEPPLFPLGPGAKKDAKEAKDQTVSATVSNAKSGITLTVSKATLQFAAPHENTQAATGTEYLVLAATFKGGTADDSIGYYDAKVKEPDGSVVAATTFIENDKPGGTVDVSSGQSKDAQIVFVIKNKSKVTGSYELQLPNQAGDGVVTGTFTLS